MEGCIIRNVVAMLSDAYDVYDTQMDETNFLVDTASKNKV
jgi:hypothetical protein